MPVVTDPADGLPAAEVGEWAEDKYPHIVHYATMFATSMRGKWECLTYLELFAGSGRARVRESGNVIDAASLRVLGINPGFDLYLFAELDQRYVTALEKRCRARRPGANYQFVRGDVNRAWPLLRDAIKKAAGRRRHLTLCFVDPYRIADLHFETIRGLSEIFIDFLVLVPSYMDAHRAWQTYLQRDTGVLDRFLGSSDWRSRWEARAEPKEKFGDFVVEQFGIAMASLGFKFGGLAPMRLVRAPDNRRPLYHLGLFSRHDLGTKFWREAKKASNPQGSLF